MTRRPLRESALPLPIFRKGKVREVYVVDDETLLLIASDRVSAFDVVMDEPVPSKGAVLTQMSAYWFRELADVVPSHFVTADADEIIARVPRLAAHPDTLRGRAMLARRTNPVPFECVVRGYLAGSAWKEYRESGTLAGEPLPPNLVESARLDPPIFSPATKAETGHDENVTYATMREALGALLADRLRALSLALYAGAADRALARGIIIADTKFEFGQTADGELLVIDEVLRPIRPDSGPRIATRRGAGSRVSTSSHCGTTSTACAARARGTGTRPHLRCPRTSSTRRAHGTATRTVGSPGRSSRRTREDRPRRMAVRRGGGTRMGARGVGWRRCRWVVVAPVRPLDAGRAVGTLVLPQPSA